MKMIYVCDECGRLEERPAIPEGGDWECECGSIRAWEFPPERALDARQHSEHILHGIGKGRIFTHARPRTRSRS